MDTQDSIMTIISSAMGGGVLVKLLDLFIKSRKVRKDELEQVFDILKNENTRIANRIIELEVDHHKVNSELVTLKTKFAILESAHFDLPIPQWMKDHNCVMLSLNPSYDKIFCQPNGKSGIDYLGKTDIEFWGEEQGKEYLENDLKVFTNQRLSYFVEEVVIKGQKQKWEVLKYPLYAGKTLIGTGGIAYQLVNTPKTRTRKPKTIPKKSI